MTDVLIKGWLDIAERLAVGVAKLTRRYEPLIANAFLRVVNETLKDSTLSAAVAAISRGDVGYLQDPIINGLSDVELRSAPLDNVVREAIVASSKLTTELYQEVTGVPFTLDDEVLGYVRMQTGSMVKGLNTNTRAALRQTVEDAFVRGIPPQELVEQIKLVVGLTPQHARAVNTYRQGLMDTKMSRARATTLAKEYANTLLTHRAQTIARTETSAAINAGQQSFYSKLERTGRSFRRVWVTHPEELAKVCATCAPLNGVEATVNGHFFAKGRGFPRPPVHPNCRCSTRIIEVDPYAVRPLRKSEEAVPVPLDRIDELLTKYKPRVSPDRVEELIDKYNPFHDPADGRFTNKPGGPGLLGRIGFMVGVGGGASGPSNVPASWKAKLKRTDPQPPDYMRPINVNSTVDVKRARELKIPPGYRSVHLAKTKTTPMQGWGIDAAGRSQRKYSKEHSAKATVNKFKRVQALQAAMPKLDRALERDATVDPVAGALTVIRYLGLRQGSDRDTKAEKKAFGATNLRAKHVKVAGATATLSFTGKHGVMQKMSTTHPQVVKAVKSHLRGKGPDEPLFGVSNDATLKYVNRVIPGYKVHDLRTAYANGMAFLMVKKMRKPKTATELKAAKMEVAKAVSEVLGNTPKVALDNYISPTVFGPWEG